ncbi:MAG: LON peptidase substrate-binding domain-containing protein [Planctomycetota bacterium]
MAWQSDGVDVRVNFARPVPVFPIDGLVVLPQQVVPLHIFEKRYRQMVDLSLDGAGQIAMALPAPSPEPGAAALRPCVCIGQIIHHEKLADGRYNILLQGVCRGTISRALQPEGDRLFLLAELEPGETAPEDESAIAELRDWIERELESGGLSRFGAAEDLLEYVRNDDIPAETIAEIVSFTMLQEVDSRYRMLAEPSPERRAELLRSLLGDLARLVRLAERQRPDDWPRGVSWN